ncbi:MAG: hypothetical protein KJT03_15565, partial [Verrucomicrobiae bacterium]|nr:hypothetical protein [Verrucomicrobiae bacterium]
APEKDDDSGKMRRMFDLFLEIISRANDFNKDIHVLSEMHALPDGQQGLFTVVYLGLSGGYYFSERSGLAGTIHWSGSGWLWEEDKSLLEDLVLLEAVLSGQEPPQFMSFPFVNSKEPLQ